MNISKLKKYVALLVVAGMFSTSVSAAGANIEALMKKPLADIEGKEAVMLTVQYAPGESSKKHRHDAYAFVYVLEGSIEMQLQGKPTVTLGVGDSFYESPNDVHLVSRNSSDTASAKFLVFMLKDMRKPIISKD